MFFYFIGENTTGREGGRDPGSLEVGRERWTMLSEPNRGVQSTEVHAIDARVLLVLKKSPFPSFYSPKEREVVTRGRRRQVV